MSLREASASGKDRLEWLARQPDQRGTMKVTVNVECTPDEARAFMGLPDVKPMQEALMKDLEDRLRTNMNAMTPDAMLNTWLPASIQGAEQLQKLFWSQMQQVFGGAIASAAEKK
jgi:hypothetical protein